MAINKNSIAISIILIAFCCGVYVLNHITTQHTFHWILVGYSLAFGAYTFANSKLRGQSQPMYLLALAGIGLCFFSEPRLSDDVYRFIWDGELLVRNVSPFAYLPEDVLGMNDDTIFKDLFTKLNSQKYYSVYPFTCQVIFFIAAILSKLGLAHVYGIKLMYVVIHFSGFYFAKKIFQHLAYDERKLWLYYLNPLVLVEGIGNLHAEIVMVGLFVMALYFLITELWFFGAVFYSLAIATKLTVLMLLPYIFYCLWKKNQIRFLIYVGLISALLFLPLILGRGIFGFVSSLDLYFRKFEFNASVYYILRYFGNIISGYNQIAIIGPMLALILLSVILKVSYEKGRKEFDIISLSQLALMIFPLHLLLSTTVHPWYLITILFFTTLVEFPAVILWSYSITWTYINYNGNIYKENYFVVFLEYLFFFGFIFYGLILKKKLKPYKH